MLYPHAVLATEYDWRTEYLAPVISVKIVNDIPESQLYSIRTIFDTEYK
jgi:gamma-glutamyl phosphate reductase